MNSRCAAVQGGFLDRPATLLFKKRVTLFLEILEKNVLIGLSYLESRLRMALLLGGQVQDGSPCWRPVSGWLSFLEARFRMALLLGVQVQDGSPS